MFVVRPAAFGANPQTAATNAFQQFVAADERVAEQVAQELAQFRELLADDVDTCVIEDTAQPPKADAVFPNNWVSFHADGTAVLYPMLAPNRRLERRLDVVEAVAKWAGHPLKRLVDLTAHEQRGEYLEGTGSLVLDRTARIAFAARSARTHPAPLAAFARELDHEVVAFDTRGADGRPIYHTNVMMWVAPTVAAACLDCVPDAGERRELRARLTAGGRDLLELSMAQVERFAGNMLALVTRRGLPCLQASYQAWSSLDAAQQALLREHFPVIAAHPVYTVERIGGGGVRCMIAEVC